MPRLGAGANAAAGLGCLVCAVPLIVLAVRLSIGRETAQSLPLSLSQVAQHVAIRMAAEAV